MSAAGALGTALSGWVTLVGSRGYRPRRNRRLRLRRWMTTASAQSCRWAMIAKGKRLLMHTCTTDCMHVHPGHCQTHQAAGCTGAAAATAWGPRATSHFPRLSDAVAVSRAWKSGRESGTMPGALGSRFFRFCGDICLDFNPIIISASQGLSRWCSWLSPCPWSWCMMWRVGWPHSEASQRGTDLSTSQTRQKQTAKNYPNGMN